MAQLKLFCDRISHASRAPLLLLHCAKVPHEEISLKLFRGEHMRRPELPFKKLPVLIDGDLTLAESTSILRYIGQLPGAGQWYGDRSVREKVKIDEYLDFWQSSFHPTAVKVLQNTLMYKVCPCQYLYLYYLQLPHYITRWCSEGLSRMRRWSVKARLLTRVRRKSSRIISWERTSLLLETPPALPTFSWHHPCFKHPSQVIITG